MKDRKYLLKKDNRS